MKKLLPLFSLALLALVLGFAACGSGESDEDKIVEVIEISATSEDPADCEALSTQAFLEQTEFRQGVAAVKHCEENNEDDEDAPDSVEVSNVEIDGPSATAEAEFIGGDSITGQTFSLALVEQDGDWKLDEITGFAEFDQEALAKLFEEPVVKEAGAEYRPIARCIGSRIRKLSRSEAEELVIGGSEKPLEELIDPCTPTE